MATNVKVELTGRQWGIISAAIMFYIFNTNKRTKVVDELLKINQEITDTIMINIKKQWESNNKNKQEEL